jgi:hypothetical protein
MKRQLVFVHGRSQEHKDSAALKAEWIEALNEGLAKSDLSLPILEGDVRFPYYGDTLNDMVEGRSAEAAAAVVIRGTENDSDQKRFMLEVLQEIQTKAGVTDEQLAQVAGSDIVQKGPLNWEWVQGILKAIDRFMPYGSGASIALCTYDVYQYLRNSIIRDRIESGIVKAINPGVETVVVGHSLGTVVSYNLLRVQGNDKGWKVPLFVTVGSPLGVSAIRKTLKSFAPTRCPECVTKWFNATDERDVVALYPLDTKSFPLNPAEPSIENKTDVRNHTSNRHGIAGYLDDQEVALRIYQALTA